MRIARKHLGWYTKDLAGGEEFRREINATETTAAQLSAVHRFFDTLSVLGERLDYKEPRGDLIDARAAFGCDCQDSEQGGEALAA